MDDGQSPTRRAHTASGLPTRSTLREREAALTQRLKDAVSREGELQGRIADAAEREAELMRKVGDLSGQLEQAKVRRLDGVWVAPIVFVEVVTERACACACACACVSQDERDEATKRWRESNNDVLRHTRRVAELEDAVRCGWAASSDTVAAASQ